MKKIVLTIVTALMFSSVAPALVATAQTTSETNTIAALQTQIASLLDQIEQMNDQIVAMQSENKAVREELQTVREEFQSYLRLGVENDEVRMLQEFLAEDSSIYPEGLVTGYFGPLTAAAVKNFQKKHDIDQVGVVGPQTRGKLNQLWSAKWSGKSNNGKSEAKVSIIINDWDDDDSDDSDDSSPWSLLQEDDDDDDHYKWGKNMILICHKPDTSAEHTLLVAQAAMNGHMKHGDIEGSCDGDASDDTAPVISNLTATQITENSAQIAWSTDESANSTVEYGTSDDLSSGVSTVSEAVFTQNHAIELGGLSASTTYYYRVTTADVVGNTATSGIESFTTEEQSGTPDTTAPVLSNVTVVDITETSANISWDTDENANSTVEYSTISDLSSGVTTLTNASYVMDHSVVLSGLTASTTYYYRVTSADVAANEAVSSIESFTTDAPAPADTTAPVLSNIAVAPTTTQATVTWDTDEDATNTVYYGTTTPLGSGTAMGATDSSFGTAHSLVLGSLTASTTYYYIVESEDAASNKATSAELQFTTLAE